MSIPLAVDGLFGHVENIVQYSRILVNREFGVGWATGIMVDRMQTREIPVRALLRDGKDPSYSHELLWKIMRYVEEGLSKEDAGKMLGVRPEKLHDWMERKPEIAVGVDISEARHKHKLLALLAQHGKRAWQAVAWMLERRYYLDYGQRSTTELRAGQGVTIGILSGGYQPPGLPQAVKGTTELQGDGAVKQLSAGDQVDKTSEL